MDMKEIRFDDTIQTKTVKLFTSFFNQMDEFKFHFVIASLVQTCMHDYFDDESLSAGENVQVNNANTLSSILMNTTKQVIFFS